MGNNLLDNIDTQAVDLGRITASSVVLVSDDMPEALAISRALRQV